MERGIFPPYQNMIVSLEMSLKIVQVYWAPFPPFPQAGSFYQSERFQDSIHISHFLLNKLN